MVAPVFVDAEELLVVADGAVWVEVSVVVTGLGTFLYFSAYLNTVGSIEVVTLKVTVPVCSSFRSLTTVFMNFGFLLN